MGRRKTQKIIKTGPKNVTTGLCPECNTIGRIFIIGQVGQERAKCQKCNKAVSYTHLTLPTNREV